MEWAIRILKQENINIRSVFMDCAEAKQAIMHLDIQYNWRILEVISNVNHLMEQAGIQSLGVNV